MASLESALNSVGKKCFVDYFYQFKKGADKNVMAKKLLKYSTKESSLESQLRRVRAAYWIFENNLEKDALAIVAESKRIDEDTKAMARQIMNS